MLKGNIIKLLHHKEIGKKKFQLLSFFGNKDTAIEMP